MTRKPIKSAFDGLFAGRACPRAKRARRAIGIEAGTVDFGNVAQRTAAAGSLNLEERGDAARRHAREG